MIWYFLAALIFCIGARAAWRSWCLSLDRRRELSAAVEDAVAAASVKYSADHPKELQAQVYGDGSAEDAASYRKGRHDVEEAARAAAIADPAETLAAYRWAESRRAIRSRE
jgi:hypothetical protein